MSGGIELLRSAMTTWTVRSNTAVMARDLGVASSVLDGFAAGTADLDAPTLDKLTKYIFQGFGTYDGQTDTVVFGDGVEPKAISGKLPPEPAMKPMLSKTDRVMRVGLKQAQKFEWNPKLDKLRGSRPEKRGSIG